MASDHPTAAEPAAEALAKVAMDGRWVLFDGDNTLWHIEVLYDRARDNLVRLLATGGAEAGEIEAFQRIEDKRLFGELGYSASRFAISFENTLRRFVPDATASQLEQAGRLARSVFEEPAEVDPDAAGVLACLKPAHHLALITAGERWVQERRLAAFRYIGLFDVVRIVERKTAALFRDLAAELDIAVSESWVVGDSLRSDIMPALDAGLRAILIANHNWIEVERDEARPRNLTVVDRLGDALPIIVAAGLGIPGPASS